MSENKVFGSLTRISDLEQRPFEVSSAAHEEWANGDYVVARVCETPRGWQSIELPTGRRSEVAEGDLIVGALGVRSATLAAVGSWKDVGEDGRMDALTVAGLIGRATSVSQSYPALIQLVYEGHVVREERKVVMKDFVPATSDRTYDRPTVLIVGTSMSAGKTTAAKLIIRLLKRVGLRVVGTKLSGAGRYRDVLGMRDAGADVVLDFVDAGLPSSIASQAEFRACLHGLLSRIQGEKPDVVVAEAGASPLEPYNGDVVLEELADHVCCTVLCASDPYAVVGVMRGFDREPDIVAGLATSTSAGIELVERMTTLPALNLLDPEDVPELRALLARCLAPYPLPARVDEA